MIHGCVGNGILLWTEDAIFGSDLQKAVILAQKENCANFDLHIVTKDAEKFFLESQIGTGKVSVEFKRSVIVNITLDLDLVILMSFVVHNFEGIRKIIHELTNFYNLYRQKEEQIKMFCSGFMDKFSMRKGEFKQFIQIIQQFNHVTFKKYSHKNKSFVNRCDKLCHHIHGVIGELNLDGAFSTFDALVDCEKRQKTVFQMMRIILRAEKGRLEMEFFHNRARRKYIYPLLAALNSHFPEMVLKMLEASAIPGL